MSTTRSMTEAELMALPRDGFKREFVDGEIQVSPAGVPHGRIIMELAWRMGFHTNAHQLGSTARMSYTASRADSPTSSVERRKGVRLHFPKKGPVPFFGKWSLTPFHFTNVAQGQSSARHAAVAAAQRAVSNRARTAS